MSSHCLVLSPSRCLVTQASCCIISRSPLIAPPSRPLIAPAGCCIASPCATLSSSGHAGCLLHCLSMCCRLVILLSCSDDILSSCCASWLLHHLLLSYLVPLSRPLIVTGLLCCLSLRCPLIFLFSWTSLPCHCHAIVHRQHH